MPEDNEGVISLTSDEEDDVVSRPQARPSASQRRGPQNARPKRRLAVNLLPETAQRRTSRRLQETVVDLTSTPDADEVVLVASTSTPAKKRRKTPMALPDSPVSQGKSTKCGICFLDMQDNMACGPCGHVFCENCLKQAVKAQKKCPSCRRALQARQIHRIYLPSHS